MCLEITQHDDVQEYVALGILNGYNNTYVLDDIFKRLTGKGSL